MLDMNGVAQMTKLSTDPASAAARPGAGAPSRAAAPPPSVFGPETMENHPWGRIIQREMDGTFDPALGKEAMAAADATADLPDSYRDQPQPGMQQAEQRRHAAEPPEYDGTHDSHHQDDPEAWLANALAGDDNPAALDMLASHGAADLQHAAGWRHAAPDPHDGDTALPQMQSNLQNQAVAQADKPRIPHPATRPTNSGSYLGSSAPTAEASQMDHLPNRPRSPLTAKPKTEPAQVQSHTDQAAEGGLRHVSALPVNQPATADALRHGPPPPSLAKELIATDLGPEASRPEGDAGSMAAEHSAELSLLSSRGAATNQMHGAEQAADGTDAAHHAADVPHQAAHAQAEQGAIQGTGTSSNLASLPQSHISHPQPGNQMPHAANAASMQIAASHASQQPHTSSGVANTRKGGGSGAGRATAIGAPGRNRQLWDGAAARLMRPTEALPPASQLDTSVLDALPLAMKRELEHAYGEPSSFPDHRVA